MHEGRDASAAQIVVHPRQSRSQVGHDARNPCGYRGFSASSVGGRCLAWSHEHHGPGGVRGRRPRPGRRARSRRRCRTSRTTAAFRKLQLAAHWADLHPATADTGVETFGGAALLADESLGGDGTPAVAAFTPEPFALALGMSPSAGAQLIADALDLRHRHPILWKRLSARGAGLAGPPGRPPDPPPVEGGGDLGRRTARRPQAPAAR